MMLSIFFSGFAKKGGTVRSVESEKKKWKKPIHEQNGYGALLLALLGSEQSSRALCKESVPT